MAIYRKLGRVSSHRQAMLRNLATSLIKHGRIKTTETRAKEARKLVDKAITLAKRGDLHARRQVMNIITEEAVVKALFDELAPKYKDRDGGYTRILKMGPRIGDAVEVVIFELV